MKNATIACIAWLVCLTSGCINEEAYLYEVTLSGEIEATAEAPNAAAVHLQFHHAQSAGVGELSHPLGEFDRMTVPSVGPVTRTLLYPKDEGTGLIVYGWLDADGDGVFCGPDKPRTEPAGLVQVTGFPAHELSFVLVLDTLCAGPESLYP